MDADLGEAFTAVFVGPISYVAVENAHVGMVTGCCVGHTHGVVSDCGL